MGLKEERLAICSRCPLFKKTWDGQHRCDSSKYLSPDGKSVSYLPKTGWVRGCNCLLEVKVTNPSAKCVAGLW